MTSFLLTCSSDDPLSRYVFQCLVRSSLDHRAESHRVCSAASVMTMYGQQSRVHTRASLLSCHDHAKCSCIGGPRRLVQSHFTCHSHERSSRFFVMLVHRTHKHQSLLHQAQHVSCLLSSVSVVLQFLFYYRACQYEMFCLAGKHFMSLTQVARVSRFTETVTTFRSRHSTFVSFIKQTE